MERRVAKREAEKRQAEKEARQRIRENRAKNQQSLLEMWRKDREERKKQKQELKEQREEERRKQRSKSRGRSGTRTPREKAETCGNRPGDEAGETLVKEKDEADETGGKNQGWRDTSPGGLWMK